jgi:hypothetical protein
MELRVIYLFSLLSKHKPVLIATQAVLSVMMLSCLAWDAGPLVKAMILQSFTSPLVPNPWAYIFFHPDQAALANYVLLALCVFVCAFLAYVLKITGYIRRNIELFDITCLILSIPLSTIFLVLAQWFNLAPRLVGAGTLLLTLLPLLPYFYKKTLTKMIIRTAAFGSTAIMLVALVMEPLALMRGPVYLMNEYVDLYGQTAVNGRLVDNRQFLDRLTMDYDWVTLLDLKGVRLDHQRARDHSIRFVRELRLYDLSPVIDYYILNKKAHNGFLSYGEEKPFELDCSINVEEVKTFYLDNYLEYVHQNMARGQINHIGHMLNPINEIMLGKPINDIYMQYGFGNTLIFKWLMELTGHISLDSYYKCYVFYIAYAFLFLLMSWVLFKNPVYIAGSFASYAFAFFATGFTGFVLAPGIIPSVHFCDVPAIIFLTLFFRHKRALWLGLGLVVSALGLLMASQFGMLLLAATVLTLLFYACENYQGKERCLRIAAIVVYAAAALSVPRFLSRSGSHGFFTYYLMGYFSFAPPPAVPVVTILYLVISYAFIFFMKNERSYFKYVYCLIFFYNQAMLVYYYWSGLLNHLPMALPLIGVQFFLTLYITGNLLPSLPRFSRAVRTLTIAAAAMSLVLVIFSAWKFFYLEKREFHANFKSHRIYHWDFDRARAASTIDPAPLKEAVALIQKYRTSNLSNGIYILSKYDNLLPFLADRYSLMPYFEMTYSLISNKETSTAISLLRDQKPPYIFVDTGIDLEKTPFDPWSKLYLTRFDRYERSSRYGRLLELKKVFDAVRKDYKVIDRGQLISVYRRRA